MLTRRAFLTSSAALALSACSGSGGTTRATEPTVTSDRKLMWSEEFDQLDLASPSNPQGKWRPNDVWQPLDEGYIDFASKSTWLVNPAQDLPVTNPFTVSNSVLTISATRTPSNLLDQVSNCPWMGGMLISNTDLPEMTFEYGYYEFRARLPTPGQGMFPALWFYAARGQNDESKGAAEIDVFEIFGSATGRPWKSTLHSTRQSDVQTQNSDTADWHTYGVDWTADRMHFYYDGKHTASASPSDVEFYRGVKMSIRLDHVVITQSNSPEAQASSSTPDTMHLEVDYIRKYDKVN